jgi:hypothetical protein
MNKTNKHKCSSKSHQPTPQTNEILLSIYTLLQHQNTRIATVERNQQSTPRETRSPILQSKQIVLHHEAGSQSQRNNAPMLPVLDGPNKNNLIAIGGGGEDPPPEDSDKDDWQSSKSEGNNDNTKNKGN